VFEVSRKNVVVLGSNFGGLTAALAVKHELHGDVDVTVVSPSPRFLFNPSLIWVPFGRRAPEDITFDVGPTFEAHGVDFVLEPATAIDPVAKTVATPGLVTAMTTWSSRPDTERLRRHPRPRAGRKRVHDHHAR
jgi:NADH dehydrogenase FAD-containing subunit